MARDYYAVLGLAPRASQDEIIEAFYRLTQKHYPHTRRSAVARVEMHDIAEAFQVLSDRRQREAYDVELRRKRQGLFKRIGVVPRQARAGLNHGIQYIAREAGKGREKLLLIALTAIVLLVVYVIAPQEHRNVQAQAQAEVDMPARLGEMQMQPQVLVVLPEPTSTLIPVTPSPIATIVSVARVNFSDAAVWSTPVRPTSTATRTPVPATAVPVVKTVMPVLPTATATATAPSRTYPAPRLVAPASGSNYACARDLVLQWAMEPAAELKENEWFVVEARTVGRENWIGLADWTREQSVLIHPTKEGKSCEIAGLPQGAFEWRVQIIQGDRNTHALQRFMSPPSAPSIINYGH